MRKTREKENGCYVSNLTVDDEKRLLRLGLSSCVVGTLFTARFEGEDDSKSSLWVKNVLLEYEVFTFPSHGCPRLLKSSAFVHVSSAGNRVACCVFWSMADFLAYDILSKTSPLSLPSVTDYFVIGNAGSFIDTVVATDEYEKVFLFLPNTDFGKTMAMTIMQRNKMHTVNCSVYFGEFDCIYDYYEKYK